MAFELPALPYSADALAPYMSANTVRLHHGKHHQKYVDTLNDLVKDTEYAGKSLDAVVVGSFGKSAHRGIFNNAGQHWNHILFWQCMRRKGGGAMPSELESRVVDSFGSVDAFKAAFINAGVTQFGSGWAWLVVDKGKLAVTNTANAENPLVHDQVALLGCDVWEHAYYLDYQNRRPDYVKAFLDHMVDWEYVASRLPG